MWFERSVKGYKGKERFMIMKHVKYTKFHLSILLYHHLSTNTLHLWTHFVTISYSRPSPHNILCQNFTSILQIKVDMVIYYSVHFLLSARLWLASSFQLQFSFPVLQISFFHGPVPLWNGQSFACFRATVRRAFWYGTCRGNSFVTGHLTTGALLPFLAIWPLRLPFPWNTCRISGNWFF